MSLQRKTPAFPKPRKPLRSVSKKRAKLNVEYRKAKAAWWAQHDGRCEFRMWVQSKWHDAGPAMRTYDTQTTTRCGLRAQPEPHHMALRGPNLCKVETFMGCCREHHDWIHAHANEARRLGYLK